MDLQLANKLALISGSTAGIGFAIAHALAAEGARVIVNGRADGVDAAVARRAPITGSPVSGFVGDVTSTHRQRPSSLVSIPGSRFS